MNITYVKYHKRLILKIELDSSALQVEVEASKYIRPCLVYIVYKKFLVIYQFH